MVIGDVMIKDVKTCGEETFISNVVAMMAKHNIGAIVVVDGDNKPVGMFSERDLLNRVIALSKDPVAVRVSEVMTENLITLSEDAHIQEAHHLMVEKGIRHLPVVSEGKLAGIVSQRVLAKAIELFIAEKKTGGVPIAGEI